VTAEIALLNKFGIALAADSATTVTYWDKNVPKTRYFKGANKVFNLSNHHPVGVMTFGSADLNGVPWEIVIKAYREQLMTDCHGHLTNYATDFFDFITSNSRLFPMAVQEKRFLSLADRAAAKITVPITEKTNYASANDVGQAALIIDALGARERALPEVTLIPNATPTDIESSVGKFLEPVSDSFRKDSFYSNHVPEAEIGHLAQLAIDGVFRSDFHERDETGLAFAGFGDEEHFPQLEQYRCHGLILGKSYVEKEQAILISDDKSAGTLPFAKSDMIEAFVNGASSSTIEYVHAIFRKQLDQLEKQLRTKKVVAATASLDQIKEDAEKQFRQDVMEYYYDTHIRPLDLVIANLPMSELAELAETLVYIESLKERVTSPEESVSGPIDVAVISKHDGFVWIKRKHYSRES
jgi:hypothetical protein